jgi:hypothetical protein
VVQQRCRWRRRRSGPDAIEGQADMAQTSQIGRS